MAWKLKLYLSNGTEIDAEDDFETREDAEADLEEWNEGWSAGADTLALAGRAYNSASIIDYDIWEE